MTATESHLPPSDTKSEAALIGAILRDNQLFDDVQKIVVPSDFYQFAHQKLFAGIAELVNAGKPADLVTASNWLKNHNFLDDAGGYGYLVEIWGEAPSAANAKEYASIIREKSILRRLIHAATEIQQRAFDPASDPAALVAHAEGLIFDINQSRKSGDVIPFREAVAAGLEALDRRSGRATDGECETSARYGWQQLDRLTGGLHPRELIVLAARPSVGKTLVAMSIVENVAVDGGRVLFSSIEQGAVELVHRVFAKRARVSSGKFRTASFNEMDREAISNAAHAMSGWTIWINDHSSQTVADIASDARRLKMRNGLDLLVVDYLQIVKSENHRANRNEQVGAISWRLKQLAKDLDVPVICLAQLNRGLENRTDPEPRLSDLRDSGEIEQNADTAIFLHKPDPPDDQRATDVLKFLIRKQRNGPLGDVTMLHDKKHFDVKEIAHE